MLYLTRMVGRPVVDSTGTQIGTMRDLGTVSYTHLTLPTILRV